MNSNSNTFVSGDLTSTKLINSAGDPVNRTSETGDSSAVAIPKRGITRVSPVNAVAGAARYTKHHGKAVVSSEKSDAVLSFRDVGLGPHEAELRFRLIHFWEARNPLTKTLIGLEMLLIDEQGIVIQGFIPPARIDTYLPHLKAGSIYRLTNFYGSKSKVVYRVAEPNVTVTFSWNSVLSASADSSVGFPEDRFRFYGYKEFDEACDRKGDLYDYVGHMKLVNEHPVNDSLVLDEAELASSPRILLHVQTHEGPLMKLYLWDKVASEFCEKFRAHGNTPRVILVTTVNPKRFGGALSLTSVTSSRVFFDSDVEPTRDYLTWFHSNPNVANMVDAKVVTKTETATIGELFSYVKQEGAKVAWFECTSTIDDVVQGTAWYYIGCGVCHTKATKGPTTLMCKKCGKNEIVGVAQYLSKISVYDKEDQANFVLIGDAGFELTGKKASELVESYFEANESMEDDHIVPVPQALIDTIGQTHKFVVKVSTHNLTGKVQSFTVTKVLRPEPIEPEGNLDEEAEDDKGASADAKMKKGSDVVESTEG
ncbi:unnamed protein product [Eruca vesicaria subsp. sativa]|uniref:Replication factor A C-terminal domain-containing protein n=1 Tax=Eruca vesicaria subsp. sativa TaxID=29727 RepID=A0ABC8KCX1_ERUVS|nr:unnamed protein product [Eruca vesicaria subsp. sativa]